MHLDIKSAKKDASVLKCSFTFPLPADQVGLIAGVCAAVSILLVVTLLIAGLMCCKKDDMERYIATR